MSIVCPFAIASVPASTGPHFISTNKQSCSPVGRITRGTSSNFIRGQLVCEGDVIREPSNVEIVCFTNGLEIQIEDRNAGIDESLCSSANASRNSTVRPCDRRGVSRLLCLVPKGPDEQFQLIRPDAVSANSRPGISWESVPEAESYTVRVIGPGISWERTVDANVTEIEYPEDEDSMIEGNAYEVFVFAKRPQELLTASKIVNIQGEDQVISLSLAKRSSKED